MYYRYDFNRLQAAIDHVDITYGQYYLHSERIVFSNGVIDPLHYKGLQFLRNPYLDSYVVNNNCKCAVTWHFYLNKY